MPELKRNNSNYWMRCEICKCRLSQGRFVDKLLGPFLNIKTPKPTLLISSLKVYIVFLCEEDNEWAKSNKEAAEAILNSKQ